MTRRGATGSTGARRRAGGPAASSGAGAGAACPIGHRGASMVEVLLASAVLALVAASLYGTMTSSVRTAGVDRAHEARRQVLHDLLERFGHDSSDLASLWPPGPRPVYVRKLSVDEALAAIGCPPDRSPVLKASLAAGLVSAFTLAWSPGVRSGAGTTARSVRPRAGARGDRGASPRGRSRPRRRPAGAVRPAGSRWDRAPGRSSRVRRNDNARSAAAPPRHRALTPSRVLWDDGGRATDHSRAPSIRRAVGSGSRRRPAAGRHQPEGPARSARREERPSAADVEIRPDGRLGPATGGPARDAGAVRDPRRRALAAYGRDHDPAAPGSGR
jgi:hypothetical protein